LLVVDEDPRGFDDLPISYFSGLPFGDQLRRRYEHYDDALGLVSPRWLVLFDGGRMLRDREVVRAGAEDVEYRGRLFRLRHSARGRIYERLD
jgi:hypothetical protein